MLGVTFRQSNPLETQVIALHICPKCHIKTGYITDSCRQCQKCKVIYAVATTTSAGETR